MEKIIKGKKYSTDTAHLVGSWDNGEVYNLLDLVQEHLYRKRTGEYFLYGEGGARTRYAVSSGDGSWRSGEEIMPLSYDKAKEWAEEHLSADAYEAEFGDVEDGAGDVATTLMLSASAKAKLKRVASQQGKSQAQVIEELIASL